MNKPETWSLAAITLFLIPCAALSYVGMKYYPVLYISRMHLIFLVFLPISLFLISLAALFLRHEIRVVISVTFVSAGLSLYLAETYLTFFSGSNTAQRQNPVEKEIGADRGLSRLNSALFPSSFPAGYLRKLDTGHHVPIFETDSHHLLPLSGPANRRLAFCDEGYGIIEFTSDRFGFRNPDHVWESNKIQAAAIGDSYTQGACVEDGEGFVDRLRDHWPKMVNLGMRGNGPLLMLASLKEYLPAVRPQKVFWFFCENNDFHELKKEKTVSLLMQYLTPEFSQHLMEKNQEVDRKLLKFITDTRQSGIRSRQNLSMPTAPKTTSERPLISNSIVQVGSWLTEFVKLRRLRSVTGLFHFRMDPELITLFLRVLEEAKRTIGSWGGELVFVMIPSSTRLEGNVLKRGYSEAVAQMVVSIAKQIDLRVIDPAPEYRSHSQYSSLYSPLGKHFSPAGYALISDAVINAFPQDPVTR